MVIYYMQVVCRCFIYNNHVCMGNENKNEND